MKEKSEKGKKGGKKGGKGKKGKRGGNILSLFCFPVYEYLPCLGKGNGERETGSEKGSEKGRVKREWEGERGRVGNTLFFSLRT